MDQDAKAARCVTPTTGGFGRGESLHEVGAESFILAVGGVLRLEEEASQVR
jgi:hypothetical protein